MERWVNSPGHTHTEWQSLGLGFLLNQDWGFVGQEDWTLRDTLGCLVLETPICSSEFASSSRGQEGGWGLAVRMPS